MSDTFQNFLDKSKQGLCAASFPDYDGEFYVPEGFIDSSIARDVIPCPSIMDKEATLVIRQDYADPARRVMEDKRYRVDICREELLDAGYVNTQPIFSSDNFNEAFSFAQEKLPELKGYIEEALAEERRENIADYDNTNPRNVYDDFMFKSHDIALDMLAEMPVYLHKDDCTVEAAAMMLLEKKYNRNAIYRAFKECSPLTAYPGREAEIAKEILTTLEKHGAEKYVTPKFLAYVAKKNEAAR